MNNSQHKNRHLEKIFYSVGFGLRSIADANYSLIDTESLKRDELALNDSALKIEK